MQDEPETGTGFSYKMSLEGRIGMLGIDHQHGRFGSGKAGADPGVSGRQRRDAIRRAAQRERLKRQLSNLGDLRPGSLVERYRKCGKANCHCAQPEEPGHGPSWSLTRDVKGKTTTKIIPKAFVPRTREQIEEYQRLRHLTRPGGSE